MVDGLKVSWWWCWMEMGREKNCKKLFVFAFKYFVNKLTHSPSLYLLTRAWPAPISPIKVVRTMYPGRIWDMVDDQSRWWRISFACCVIGEYFGVFCVVSGRDFDFVIPRQYWLIVKRRTLQVKVVFSSYQRFPWWLLLQGSIWGALYVGTWSSTWKELLENVHSPRSPEPCSQQASSVTCAKYVQHKSEIKPHIPKKLNKLYGREKLNNTTTVYSKKE